MSILLLLEFQLLHKRSNKNYDMLPITASNKNRSPTQVLTMVAFEKSVTCYQQCGYFHYIQLEFLG